MVKEGAAICCECGEKLFWDFELRRWKPCGKCYRRIDAYCGRCDGMLVPMAGGMYEPCQCYVDEDGNVVMDLSRKWR